MNRFMVSVLAAAWVTTSAGADWNEGDPFKMHFPQLPDPTGWDVNATFPKVLADDWLCTASGPVDDIHFWGSWREDLVGPISNIHLSIHANIPDGGQGFSIPGEELWSWDTGPTGFTDRLYGEGPQGWYDPNTGQWQRDDHFMFFQYNVMDIPDPFIQEEGTIYWLDVSVMVDDPVFQWGWKTSQDHFMDDAVWGDFPDPQWRELFDPKSGESLDMAFVIVPGPGAASLFIAAGLLMRGRRRRR